jgi:hypothetical protein
MVNSISFDCSIAPHKSIRLTTKKEFIKDVQFKGLSHEKARSLESYIHLRQPELQKIYDANTFTQTNEVLDKITDDLPPSVSYKFCFFMPNSIIFTNHTFCFRKLFSF